VNNVENDIRHYESFQRNALVAQHRVLLEMARKKSSKAVTELPYVHSKDREGGAGSIPTPYSSILIWLMFSTYDLKGGCAYAPLLCERCPL